MQYRPRTRGDTIVKTEKIVNGHLFEQDPVGEEYSHFFRLTQKWNDATRRFDYLTDHDDDSPDIMCECGGVAFEIRQKDYDTSARCVVCGKESVIHSG
jgi:hypothetical protein